jgi:hypothetical protein
MTVSENHLRFLDVPADVIAAAKQLGLDFKALLVLLLTHGVDGVRALLNSLLGKLPVTPPVS